jgi:hypothetical protein
LGTVGLEESFWVQSFWGRCLLIYICCYFCWIVMLISGWSIMQRVVLLLSGQAGAIPSHHHFSDETNLSRNGCHPYIIEGINMVKTTSLNFWVTPFTIIYHHTWVLTSHLQYIQKKLIHELIFPETNLKIRLPTGVLPSNFLSPNYTHLEDIWVWINTY